MLEELNGMNASRKVVEMEVSVLERLIHLSHEIVSTTPKISYSNFGEQRDILYQRVQDRLDFDYCPEDIVSLTRAESTVLDSEKDKQSFGFYTGALLSLLTDKNRKLGKETVIHIKNIDLDYMLLGVKNADTIIIENCEGNSILKHAGSHEGSVTNVTLNNIKGDNAGRWIGSCEGSVNNVTLNNITGDYTGYMIGSYEGSVNNVILNNITGHYAGGWIGSYKGNVNNITLNNITGQHAGGAIGSHKGSVNNITLNNIKGNNAGVGMGSHGGSVTNVTLNNITGDYTGYMIGSYYEGSVNNVILNNITGHYAGGWIGSYKGNVNNITLNNITGQHAGGAIGSHKGSVSSVLYNNIQGTNPLQNAHAHQIIWREKNPELYNKRTSELGLKEVMELLNKPELDTNELLEALKNA